MRRRVHAGPHGLPETLQVEDRERLSAAEHLIENVRDLFVPVCDVTKGRIFHGHTPDLAGTRSSVQRSHQGERGVCCSLHNVQFISVPPFPNETNSQNRNRDAVLWAFHGDGA